MSLDIALLGTNGKPEEQICIGLDNYDRLMQLADKDDCMLQRLNDYYADAEFQNEEIEDLIKELFGVREKSHNSESFLLFVDSLIELAERAKQKHQPIVAIAD